MTFDEFSRMTRRLIDCEGIDNYLPTVCYPARREIRVLTGIPDGEDVEAAVLEWAARSVKALEEFVVAFRLDETRLKIVRRVGPYEEDDVFSVA